MHNHGNLQQSRQHLEHQEQNFRSGQHGQKRLLNGIGQLLVWGLRLHSRKPIIHLRLHANKDLDFHSLNSFDRTHSSSVHLRNLRLQTGVAESLDQYYRWL
jgi:hypothetical protein